MMWKTALLLIVSLIVLPILTSKMDVPLTDIQYHILIELLVVYAVSVAGTFLISSATKNYSQVDKLWSVIPIVYVWLTYYHTPDDTRILLMAILVTIWGVRLTYNFSRRGGYQWKFWQGDEDYRWAILMERKEFQNPLIWMLFNLLFISIYQLGLILLFTLPILKAVGGGPLGIWDYVLAGLVIGAILLETIADQQQWDYQNQKHDLKRDLNDPAFKDGFVKTGLWSIVRHPNYAMELSVWIFFYFFSVIATGIWVNWSIAGCVLLILLFKGSSDFSEGISASKYPAYKEYQEKVGKFIPKFW